MIAALRERVGGRGLREPEVERLSALARWHAHVDALGAAPGTPELAQPVRRYDDAG